MIGFLTVTLEVLLLLLACLEAGHRLRLRNREEASSGNAVVDAAIFGLLGLLLAFAFAGADNRFETRRQLIVKETNAIRSVWLRIDLLPEEDQPAIRHDLRSYLDARIAFYRDFGKSSAQADADSAIATALQKKIWIESLAAAKRSPQSTPLSAMVEAIDGMIDVTTMRSAALMTHPPLIVYILLLVLSLASALVAGYGMGDRRRRSWLHTIVYATALTLTIYTIIDLEFPRAGLIRLDRYDQLLVDLRSDMKEMP
ncbi:hypothetical protein [Silvibacterium sp.]|uniref:bestrophin-like domain n=1 Tax=Silvibacterium sp. TaxID=1964179 RepID=UPI0039E36D65